MYYYTRNTPSFKSGHSGPRIYIAKTIVEKHDGCIKAKNNAPKGAVIRFSIMPL